MRKESWPLRTGRIVRPISFITPLFALTACGGVHDISVPLLPVSTSFAISAPTDRITSCQTTQLSVINIDSAGPTVSPTSISWSSAEPRIAKVSSTGLVAGVGVGGPVTITATSGGKRATTEITVLQRPMYDWLISVQPAEVTLVVGDTARLHAVEDVNDALYDYNVTWESQVPTVAAVSADGLVTALTVGDASIRLTFFEPAIGFDASVCPQRTYTSFGTVTVRPITNEQPARGLSLERGNHFSRRPGTN
jgi:uncharacterized protein YjdB